MRLGSYSAIITSNESRLEEYQVQVSHEGRMATCWVASNEGQRFGVNCNLGKGQDTLRIRLFADGVLLDKRIADKMHHCCLSGNRLNSREKRPFEFAQGVVPIEEFDPPEVEEDEDEEDGAARIQARDTEMWSERGTITVEFFRVKVEYGQLPPPEEHRYFATSSQGLHTIRVGRTEISHRLRLRNIINVEPDAQDEPLVTFKFKHRPRAWLEMYGIIPRGELDLIAGLTLSSLEGEGEESRKRRRSPTPVYVKKLARLGMGEDGEESAEDEQNMDDSGQPRHTLNHTRVADEPLMTTDPEDDADSSSPSSEGNASIAAQPGTPTLTPPAKSRALDLGLSTSVPLTTNGMGQFSFALPHGQGGPGALELENQGHAVPAPVGGLGGEDKHGETFLLYRDGGDEDSPIQPRTPTHPHAHTHTHTYMQENGRDADGRSPTKRRRSEGMRSMAEGEGSGRPLITPPVEMPEVDTRSNLPFVEMETGFVPSGMLVMDGDTPTMGDSMDPTPTNSIAPTPTPTPQFVQESSMCTRAADGPPIPSDAMESD